MRRFGPWTIVSFLLWIALTATLAKQELIAGAIVATAIGVVGVGISALHVIDWRVPRELPQMLARLPMQVAHDIVVLAAPLARRSPPPSVFRALPFDTSTDDPHAVGLRALVGLFGSVGPNTIVIGFDTERNLVLVHQLVPNEQVLPLRDGRYPT